MTDTVPLREHFEALNAERDKAIFAALAAQERAVKLAEENAALWRANANEWRGAMGDREKNFAPRDQLESLKKLVYVGLGILMTVQFLLMYLKGE